MCKEMLLQWSVSALALVSGQLSSFSGGVYTSKESWGLIVFENKTYILEPMKNTTDRYKLVPAENMKNTQGLCGSHHNQSSLTVDVSPEPSQMWSRRHKRETLKMTKYVELVIVADNREVIKSLKSCQCLEMRLGQLRALPVTEHRDQDLPLDPLLVLVSSTLSWYPGPGQLTGLQP
ncbi:disintegrin and metalloproteinase domain-containing protein 12 precursor [Cricetulus griseus]|nr:disintegrin and metalloproteinase domain-containing protein 12 precursor [Cricetulus griseus]